MVQYLSNPNPGGHNLNVSEIQNIAFKTLQICDMLGFFINLNPHIGIPVVKINNKTKQIVTKFQMQNVSEIKFKKRFDYNNNAQSKTNISFFHIKQNLIILAQAKWRFWLSHVRY